MAIPGLNSKVLDKIVNTLGLQSTVEKLPTDLGKTIQPVLVSNPDKHVDVVRSRTSSGTIYTVPNKKKKFFLTGFTISATSTAVAAAARGSITITPKGGAAVSVGIVNTETTAAVDVSRGQLAVDLTHEIELEPDSNVTLTIFGTLSSISAVIYGYFEEVL